MIRAFFKGFLLGLICICLLGLLWLFVAKPYTTAAEADALKAKYILTVPGAERSGDFSAGQETSEILLDFSALQATYPDVKGWLTIPGTYVDYPVVQSSVRQPEYYLRRNYKGEWRMAGSLFFQWDCTLQSKNTVVYGHNMNDGSMFAVLPKLADEVFRQAHPEILLQTVDGLSQYKVFAVLQADTTQLTFNRTAFADDTDFLSFIESLLPASQYKSPYIPSTNDRLLTLVTCSQESENVKTVVVAVQVKWVLYESYLHNKKGGVA